MPYIKVNDIQMYYEIHGDGEPLVLIVGLGTDISEWDGIIHWLAQKYKVLAFDNRGAGRTDKPDTHYSIEMMANDTAGLMQALGIQQAYILGISMGGRIALALALQHPKSVKKLVLVSTSARSIKNWRSHFFSMLSGMPIFRSKYPQPRYAFTQQRQASFVYNCTGKLHELHIPTVIMHGKKDKIVPYKLAEEMHTGIKGSKMLTFSGGHIFFFMKERQQFLDAIAEFVGT
ncbi:MAG: alpha/beta fold hydrolase [Ktedonobacteraceae bacterium]